MEFSAKVFKDTTDTYYKIIFTCRTEDVFIEKGYARVHKEAGKNIIMYDARIASQVGLLDKSKLELELMNKVLEHILSKGFSRSLKGRLYLNAV